MNVAVFDPGAELQCCEAESEKQLLSRDASLTSAKNIKRIVLKTRYKRSNHLPSRDVVCVLKHLQQPFSSVVCQAIRKHLPSCEKSHFPKAPKVVDLLTDPVDPKKPSSPNAFPATKSVHDLVKMLKLVRFNRLAASACVVHAPGVSNEHETFAKHEHIYCAYVDVPIRRAAGETAAYRQTSPKTLRTLINFKQRHRCADFYVQNTLPPEKTLRYLCNNPKSVNLNAFKRIPIKKCLNNTSRLMWPYNCVLISTLGPKFQVFHLHTLKTLRIHTLTWLYHNDDLLKLFMLYYISVKTAEHLSKRRWSRAINYLTLSGSARQQFHSSAHMHTYTSEDYVSNATMKSIENEGTANSQGLVSTFREINSRMQSKEGTRLVVVLTDERMPEKLRENSKKQRLLMYSKHQLYQEILDFSRQATFVDSEATCNNQVNQQADVGAKAPVPTEESEILRLAAVFVIKITDLRYLRLHSLPLLRVLDVSQSAVTVLDIRGLPDLLELTGCNSLRTLITGSHPHMQQLKLAWSAIRTLDLRYMPSLVHIDVSWTRIRFLSVAGLTCLKSINACDTRIRSIAVAAECKVRLFVQERDGFAADRINMQVNGIEWTKI